MILVQFDANRKVVAQRNDDQLGDELPEWTDLTNHPDGPSFQGRTQLPNGSFTPVVTIPKSRRQELKEKTVWTPAERDEAMRMLL